MQKKSKKNLKLKIELLKTLSSAKTSAVQGGTVSGMRVMGN